MFPRTNSMVWMEGSKESNDQNISWAQNNIDTNNNTTESSRNKEQMDDIGALSTFKSMLEAEGTEDDWYLTNNTTTNTTMHGHENSNISLFSPSFTKVAADHHHHQLMLNPMDSLSASCSPTSASVFNDASFDHMTQHNNQVNYFLPPTNNNPLQGTFDLSSCRSGGYDDLENALMSRNTSGGFGDLGTHNSQLNLSTHHQFGGGGGSNHNNLQLHDQLTQQLGVGGFGSSSSSFKFGDSSSLGGSNDSLMFFNRSNKNILKPLDHNFASVGSQPTLFQKRAALRKNNLGSNSGDNLGSLNIGGQEMSQIISLKAPTSQKNSEREDSDQRKKKAVMITSSGYDHIDDLSFDGSNLNYDSDDLFLENSNGGAISKAEESAKNGSNMNSTVTGGGIDQKGKKKGLPAKNLMAERRRRKKLNDRLYMLRSVVPKISKMDRASILGDAIDYLKELLQKINDLHNELESSPGSSSLNTPTTTNFYPLTPTTARIKEELCPSGFPSPLSSPTAQPARVEVRLREGRAVNIHMFCGRRPGLLLSTLRAMDNLGLDVQQAVISCFNGFALDIFRAEQCSEGEELNPDQIKAVLLESAGFQGMV